MKKIRELYVDWDLERREAFRAYLGYLRGLSDGRTNESAAEELGIDKKTVSRLITGESGEKSFLRYGDALLLYFGKVVDEGVPVDDFETWFQKRQASKKQSSASPLDAHETDSAFDRQSLSPAEDDGPNQAATETLSQSRLLRIGRTARKALGHTSTIIVLALFGVIGVLTNLYVNSVHYALNVKMPILEAGHFNIFDEFDLSHSGSVGRGSLGEPIFGTAFEFDHRTLGGLAREPHVGEVAFISQTIDRDSGEIVHQTSFRGDARDSPERYYQDKSYTQSMNIEVIDCLSYFHQEIGFWVFRYNIFHLDYKRLVELLFTQTGGDVNLVTVYDTGYEVSRARRDCPDELRETSFYSDFRMSGRSEEMVVWDNRAAIPRTWEEVGIVLQGWSDNCIYINEDFSVWSQFSRYYRLHLVLEDGQTEPLKKACYEGVDEFEIVLLKKESHFPDVPPIKVTGFFEKAKKRGMEISGWND